MKVLALALVVAFSVPAIAQTTSQKPCQTFECFQSDATVALNRSEGEFKFNLAAMQRTATTENEKREARFGIVVYRVHARLRDMKEDANAHADLETALANNYCEGFFSSGTAEDWSACSKAAQPILH